MRMTFSLATYALIPLLIFSLTACAGRRPAPSSEENPPGVLGPVITEGSVEEQPVSGENYGPEAPPGGVQPEPISTSTATDTAVAPAPSPTPAPAPGAPKLCLVLGPGMAKAMAEAAVLASLRKAKVPIHCVVGVEMGAVVGALYSFSNGSTNSLQWQLFKLNKETYFNFPMLSLREPLSTGRKLHEFLRGIFKDKKMEDLPIPFATIVMDDERDSSVELDRGDLADALSASVAVAGVFDPWRLRGEIYRSGALSDPAPVELARKLGGNFIVVVDVLADVGAADAKSRFQRALNPARSLMKLQKKDASFVIQVTSSGIPFDDFGRQGEILAAGTAAAEKALPELKAAWEKFSAGAR